MTSTTSADVAVRLPASGCVEQNRGTVSEAAARSAKPSARSAKGMSALSHELNPLGQPIGTAVLGWTPPPRPSPEPMVGRFCRVEPLDADRHAADLHAANALDVDGRNWTYLPYGPFDALASYAAWAESVAGHDDPQFWAIVDRETDQAVGVASYLRIDPASG